jgi:hypothetical protein
MRGAATHPEAATCGLSSTSCMRRVCLIVRKASDVLDRDAHYFIKLSKGVTRPPLWWVALHMEADRMVCNMQGTL